MTDKSSKNLKVNKAASRLFSMQQLPCAVYKLSQFQYYNFPKPVRKWRRKKNEKVLQSDLKNIVSKRRTFTCELKLIITSSLAVRLFCVSVTRVLRDVPFQHNVQSARSEAAVWPRATCLRHCVPAWTSHMERLRGPKHTHTSITEFIDKWNQLFLRRPGK